MYSERLIELRNQKKITKREVAKELNVSESTYGKWELGQRKPDIETISALANFFNVSIDYLVGKSDDPTPLNKKKPTPETVGLALTDMLKKAGYLNDDKPLTDEEADRLLRIVKSIHEDDIKGK